MNCRILISLFIAFIFEDINTSPSKHLSSKYDIKKTLQSSIQSMHSRAAELWNFFSCEQRNPQDITFSSKFGNKTYVCDLNFDSYKLNNFNLYYKFIDNKVVLKITKCNVNNKGWVIENSTSKYRHFTKQSIYYDGNTILESDGSTVNVSRGNSYPLEYLIELGDAEGLTKGVLKPLIIQRSKNKLIECVSPRIKKFALDLSNYTRTIFTSNHPYFFLEEQQHYFLIPNISLICFDLMNITIKGLTNFHSLEITKEQTLLNLGVGNIRGEMVLDYRSEVETPMKVNFVADYFAISFNLKEPSINVEIVNYRVFRTMQNITLTDDQSNLIIRQIESATASSLMPSMKVWWKTHQLSRKYDTESSTEKMLIDMLQNSDLNSKKKVLKKWVPFNEDHITTDEKLHPYGKNRTESYHYRVSFRNVTINAISSISYPEKLVCELPNNLNITREIKATPIRTEISLSNETGNYINIHFHVNFPFVNFSNTKLNNDCEFQLKNNEDIEVNLPPAKKNRKGEMPELKEKIDKTLISMAKERIVLNIKPIVCLPYDVCSRSLKMVHNLFSRYIDKVLEKCSLQRVKE